MDFPLSNAASDFTTMPRHQGPDTPHDKLFAEQTNIYANQFLAANPNLKPQFRARSWMDTNPTEMKTLIGFLILQGIVQKPENGLYFSKRESIVTPYFSQIMTEKRFHLLLKFLHFADNSKFDPDQRKKKLYKIQPILDHLKSKFSSVYTPERSICVDESLILWKGRLGWIQYIPSKRSRFEVKIYKLCESSTGYLWNFIVYTGKDTIYGQRHPREKTSSRIVLLSYWCSNCAKALCVVPCFQVYHTDKN